MAVVALALTGALWIALRADLSPVAVLEGPGRNIDSLAFWSGGTPDTTFLFATAQDNHLVEVWRHPFERAGEPLVLEAGVTVNGVAVDPASDRLYVTSGWEGSGRFEVLVFSLPALEPLHRFGLGTLGEGETNLAILHARDGATLVFASDDHRVHVFREGTGSATWLRAFAPPVSEIETLMADDRTQLVYVPEERGGEGIRPGVHVFDPEGRPHTRAGTNVFGEDRFDADAEGIALYRCLDAAGADRGSGFIVVSDQRQSRTELEFFDRGSWEHLGMLSVAGLAHTDGLAVLETPLPGHPRGLLAAVHDDQHTVLVDAAEILDALGVDCAQP